MDINALIEAMFLILRQRYPSSGYISIKHNNNTKCTVGEWNWYVVIEVQPDMDMIDLVQYSGGGAAIYEATQDVFRKVVNEIPVGYEKGMG